MSQSADDRRFEAVLALMCDALDRSGHLEPVLAELSPEDRRDVRLARERHEAFLRERAAGRTR